MKKILILMALVCAVLNLSAQEDSKWSIKVGAGLSSLAGSDTDGAKNAFAYNPMNARFGAIKANHEDYAVSVSGF